MTANITLLFLFSFKMKNGSQKNPFYLKLNHVKKRKKEKITGFYQCIVEVWSWFCSHSDRPLNPYRNCRHYYIAHIWSCMFYHSVLFHILRKTIHWKVFYQLPLFICHSSLNKKVNKESSGFFKNKIRNWL